MKRLGKMAGLAGLALAMGMTASAQLPSEVSADFLKNAKILHADHHPNKSLKGSGAPESSSVIPGVDSIVNFGSSFTAPGIGVNGSEQNNCLYAMVGNPPDRGGITFIHAPIIPVSLDL
jgi:hypothetical protein